MKNNISWWSLIAVIGRAYTATVSPCVARHSADFAIYGRLS